MCSQKGFCTASFHESHCPFQQFVAGADCHTNADDQKHEPPSAGDYALTDEDLACNDGWNESLREVAHFVVIVSLEVELVAKPIEQRNVRIGVMRTDEEDAHVQCDEYIGQASEWESPICHD